MKSSPRSRAWCGRSWWRTRSPSSSDSSSSGWTPMPEAPQAGQATFNFKAAITQMVQCNASDLLLKVGRPATIRVNGELVALDSSSPLKPEELKSLAPMINHINTNRRVNIITIEDPIEFLHRDNLANISQREVGNDTLSFNAALRHVLRQAPDVILIGEIRDMETLDTALKAADTGHLVFSTLHT